eukprot:CAMPEP_0205801840 /NCGR_PEP_ID=MMETSP0205-20121125/3965_1 /ASSEMBLY_ACC=CAM_ASM_000278 /TAXON_ID=36767 /ORGANISM="Euplotes focardii, Strain TN1" /LENGTH=73 /DNA_ID=CAMNT_0053067263 /DNA_START=22 /DNA_END=240 /DNA_ORIENTATION=+
MDILDEFEGKGTRISHELSMYTKMQLGFGEKLLSILPENLFIYIQSYRPKDDSKEIPEITLEDLSSSDYPQVW